MKRKKLDDGTYAKSLAERIDDSLRMMKHKDLVIACISRGLEPEKAVTYDHHDFANFFWHNFENAEDPKLLIIYDAFVETQLQQRGHKKGEAIMSPSLRLSFTPEMTDVKNLDKPVIKRPVLEDKPKREKDETHGILKGTKKSLTYDLTLSGKSLSDVVDAVMKAFPDAQDKSIKIWYKRALNLNKETV